jgi:two-component system sensor histidine kinase KdpD
VKRVEENNFKRKIDISINQQMPLCSIDKGMLEQVIYNLLNNAAIHTEAGTMIHISVALHADLLQIIIEDEGKGFAGIDPKDVFQKFSRTKNLKTSGSGLGLSIVKGFTEALGGNVTLEMGKTGGALFTILIPVKTSHLNFA